MIWYISTSDSSCIFFLTGSFLFQYLDLFLTRIDGLRRRILFSGEVEGVLDYLLIRETFQVCKLIPFAIQY